MGEGFLGEITRERRIVTWLLVGGFLLMLGGADALNVLDCRADLSDEDDVMLLTCENEDLSTFLGIVFLLGLLCTITGMLIVQFSVLRTTGSNGEWLWFAFTLTGSAGLLYYILDAIGSNLVEGA